MKTTAKSILDSYASPTPSKWRERAEYRRSNRKWIRRSQQIALAILERLTELGMSQKELAEEMEVSAQYVSKVLKGSENLSLETIAKFESILSIELIVVKQQTTVKLSNIGWQFSWQKAGSTTSLETSYHNATQSKYSNSIGINLTAA